MDGIGDDKMINACIFDNQGKLAGCITPNVIEQFNLQLDNLQDIDEQTYDFLYEMLIQSEQNNSAEFLNALKTVVRDHKDELPVEQMQRISKAYHNLVRYCCSTAVYDEVFDYTLSVFRENNLEYKGKSIQDDNECLFDYNGIMIGVIMSSQNDLYNLWYKGDKQIEAIVYFKDKTFGITETFIEVLIQAAKACVDDCKCEQESEGIESENLKQIAEKLLEIAKILINKGNNDVPQQ